MYGLTVNRTMSLSGHPSIINKMNHTKMNFHTKRTNCTKSKYCTKRTNWNKMTNNSKRVQKVQKWCSQLQLKCNMDLFFLLFLKQNAHQISKVTTELSFLSPLLIYWSNASLHLSLLRTTPQVEIKFVSRFAKHNM